MEQTLTILGVARIISAIVGGGVTAAGHVFPVINTLARQILLGLFGVTLVTAANSTKVDYWLRTIFYSGHEKISQVLSNSGKSIHGNWAVTTGRPGSIFIQMVSTSPPRDSNGEPYGLRVVVCPPFTVTNCPSEQMAAGDVIRIDAPKEGRYRIDVWNFDRNPAIGFVAEIRYPQ